ncbi:MAG TPA: carboxypeptidase-like regulatory domain-containing protein [Thermoleophilaceae bacterium]|nr:carboxypeptidase-like regulatory domain-containing protein [Thermoleophilaceae bacterium]
MRSPRWTRIAVVAALAALAAAGSLPAPAEAGSYRYFTCKTPTGRAVATDGWSSSSSAASSSLTNDCASGGPLRALMNGSVPQPSNAILTWQFSAPPNTSIAGFRIWRSVTVSFPIDGSLPNYLLAWPANNHGDARETCSYTVNCSAKGSHNNAFSAGNFISASGLSSVESLFFNVTCENAACPGRGEAMGDLRIHAAELTLSDPSAPSASAVSGQLTAPGPHRGTESVGFDASDVGSGVYRALFEVDGSVVSSRVVRSNGGACADAGEDPADAHEFTARVPCPLSVQEGSASLDTTALRDGTRSLRILLEDASGNRTTIHGPAAFEVDNVPPPAVRDGAGPAVTIDGDRPIPGAVARAVRGDWTGDGNSYAYAWQRCSADGVSCAAIEGATTPSYLISDADVGRRLRVVVTASNAEGSTSAASPATAAVFRPETHQERTPAPPAGEGPGGQQAPEPGPPNGTNASERAQLTATFGRSRSSSLRARYGAPVEITGRLLDPAERPIGGARLSVLAQPMVSAARFDEIGAVRTDPDGRFRYMLPAGPSRVVRIGYHARLGDSQFADVTEITVLVAAGVSLRTSPRKLRNGSVGTLRGRVAGPLPVRGVLVDLQARVGRQWRTFAVVRTTGAGRYRHRHRFRQTFRTTRFRFRARVRRDSDYPYLAGTSRIASLLVRP